MQPTMVFDALSQILIDAALKGTLLLGIAWCVTAGRQRTSAAFRHHVWSLALIGLIALPAVSILVPKLHWPVLRANYPAGLSHQELEKAEVPDAVIVHSDGPVHNDDRAAIPVERQSPATMQAWSEFDTSQLREAPRRMFRLSSVVGVWCAGLVICFVRIAISYWHTSRLTRESQLVQDEAWLRLTDQLRQPAIGTATFGSAPRMCSFQSSSNVGVYSSHCIDSARSAKLERVTTTNCFAA